MKKIILWFSLLLIGILTIPTVLAEEVTRPASNTEVTIELNHDNQSFEGTTFSIYGISRKNYEYALSHKYEISVEKTKTWLSEQGISKVKEVWVSSSNKASFNLPKYNAQQELMYYIILQNKPDYEGEDGKEVYESFPSFVSLEGMEEDFISIHTKRVVMSQMPYFFKYSSGLNQQPLAEAEFVLYRENLLDEREYLIDIEPLRFQVIKNVKEAFVLTSDKKGLMVLPTTELPKGTYYFEEIKAPQGYKMTEFSKKVSLVISEDTEGNSIININGDHLIAFQAGELPQEVINSGLPRVLNDPLKDTPIKEEPPKIIPEGKEPPKKGYLPKTGESVVAVSGFGLLLMFVAYSLMKRVKENE